MEDLGDGQLRLLDLFANVCRKVTDSDANEIAKSAHISNPYSFVQQFEIARNRGTKVDNLQKECDRLRRELDKCLTEPNGVKPPSEKAQHVELESRNVSAAKVYSNIFKRYVSPPYQNDTSPSSMRASPEKAQSLSTSLSGQGGTHDTNLSFGSTDNIELNISEDAENLRARLKATVAAWKIAKSAIEDLQYQLRKSKQNEKKWMDYAEHLAKKQRSVTIGDSLPINSEVPIVQDDQIRRSDFEGDTLISPCVTYNPKSPAFLSRLDLHPTGDQTSRSKTKAGKPAATNTDASCIEPQEPLPSLPSHGLKASDDLPSHPSSSTEGEPEINSACTAPSETLTPFIKEEPMSDTPVIISSRPVRKRKGREHSIERTNPKNTKVKLEEVLSSSPIGLGRLEYIDAHDSIDLDEIGEKIDTPKKRRRILEASKANSRRVRAAPGGYLGDGLEPLFGTPESIRKPSIPKTTATLSRSKGMATPLQPRSPNKQILPRTSGPARNEKRRRMKDRMRGAEVMGEDAEHTQTESKETITLNQTSPIRLSDLLERNSRLSGLLDAPSPKKYLLTPGDGTMDSRFRPLSASEAQSTPQLPSTKRKVLRSMDESVAIEADDPDHEPFRARPLKRLGLEHFKVNPNYNQGYDYAFSDVVRGREQRRCLPGCTKPDCCGDKFRKMAESLLNAEQKLTLSQRARDEQLIEEHMGIDKFGLHSLSTAERDEFLLRAKTKELSNKHGKHRHAFERRKSPPGFWRTDFPSTQEEKQDRAEAAKFEREVVRKRYEEAIRPNGSFLFRDE